MSTKPTPRRRRRSPARGKLLAAAWIGLLALSMPDPARAQAHEYAVKAALLYNFSKFLTWPEDAFDASQDFRICIYGEDPFGSQLDAVGAKRTRGRPIVVSRHTETTGLAGSCHIVFVGERRGQPLREALRSLKHEAMLTVGDGRRFVDRGGMIGLVREGSRIRFEINRRETQRAGLAVSAQLLRVAHRVVED
ncbi:MAG: YfiR family protein [Myxococcota bacterium]|nr:YfiR family protein [Myxococcota bacterium]